MNVALNKSDKGNKKNAFESAVYAFSKAFLIKQKLISYLISVTNSFCGVLTFFMFTSQSFASSL